MSNGKKIYSIKIDGIKESVTDTSNLGNSLKELRQKLKGYKDEMAGVEQGTKEWKALAKEAGNYKDKIDDINAAIKRTASDTRALDDIIDVAKTATGAFTLWKGAMSAFGVESEGAVEAIQKLQGAMAIIQSLQTLQNTLKSSSASAILLNKAMNILTLGIKGTTTATKALKIGLASIGIGLIIGLVATLIEHWDRIKKSLKDTFPILGELSKRFNGFKGVIFGVGNAIKTALMMPFEKLGKAFMKLIKGDFSGAVKELTSGWSDAWQKIKDGFKSGVEYSRESNEEIKKDTIKTAKSTAKEVKDIRKKMLDDLVKAEKKAQDDIQKYRDQKRKENEKKQKETEDALFNLKEAEYKRDLAVLQAMGKENEALELTAQWNDYIIKHNAAKELGISVEELNNLLNISNGLYKDLDEKSKAIVDKVKVQLETNSIKKSSGSTTSSSDKKESNPLLDWFNDDVTKEFISLGQDTFDIMADSISMMMDWAIEEAEEKLNEVTELHDKALGQVKESQDQIAELNEKMKDASGSRLEDYKQQIADEVLLQQQREAEEKRLAKEKEKREKELQKREKEAAKAEVKMQIAQAFINTGMAVTKAFAQWGWPMGAVFGAILSALGTVQVAMMTKQLSKMADGGLLQGRSHAEGGIPVGNTGIEVEGGEYVVNKRSTAKYLPLLQALNEEGARKKTRANQIGKFANGGELNFQRISSNADAMSTSRVLANAISSIDMHPQVSVVDINRGQRNLVQVRQLAGASD